MDESTMKDAQTVIDIFNAGKGVNFTLDTTLREYLPVFMNPDINYEAICIELHRQGNHGANVKDLKSFASGQKNVLVKLFDSFKRHGILKWQLIEGFLWAISSKDVKGLDEPKKIIFEELKPEK